MTAVLLTALALAGEVDPTWDLGDDLQAAAIEMVTADVRTELAQGAPWLELEQLPSLAADPGTLPRPLSGRANEALWSYVPVLVAEGDTELAIDVVELLRNPDVNVNPKVIWHGSLTYAELARSQASGRRSQRAAIREILGELPAKRFFESTAGLSTLVQAAEEEAGSELPQMLSSYLESVQTYPMNPRTASKWLRIHHLTRGTWEHIDLYDEVYQGLYAEAQQVEPRPYAFRTVNMEDHADRAHPVVLGIFDSGVAPLRYNMYQNPGEQPNGLDDDGNGVVDDVSGLVWDWDPATRHHHSNLDLVEVLPPDLAREYETYLVGYFDLEAGRETADAAAVQAKLASLSTVEEQKEFEFNMSRIGEWSHGTHVAGLATAGNRWAAVASFRLSWTGEIRIYHERGPSDQELRWERESIHELIAWINDHDVRVVNASLGFTVDYQEALLSKERDVFEPDKPAWGKRDAEGRLTHDLDLERIHQRAVQIQEFRRQLWKELFDGCPDTLFVLAAGNGDHDIAEYQDVPVTIEAEHDNLLLVGAVDGEGDWAAFTNFNEELVQVYDFGVNAVSHTPTGRMIPMSGTSMSAPNAANTVGKLFSLYPDLTPAQVKQILVETADPMAPPFHGGIVDEVAAVERAGQVASGR